MNNFIFIDVIEKYKEMKQKIHDDYTPLKTEIVNKATSNETGKKKKFDGDCYYCNKKNHRKNKCRQWLNTDENKK